MYLRFGVNLRSAFRKLAGFLLQANLKCVLFGNLLLGGKFPNVLRDLHGAEVRAAHGTEVRGLGAFLRERFVMELAGGFGIEREIELVLPAKFETRFADGVVAILRAGMAFGQIRRVGGDLIGDNAVFDVFFVRQTEMLLRSDVTQHRGAVPADHGRADGAGDVIVAGGDVGRERAQSVEGRFVAPFELFLHVLLDQMHGDVARAFVHHLHVMRPRAPGQLALRI